MATVTACVRSSTPSLANARSRWVFTVASPMDSSRPIWALVRPRATARLATEMPDVHVLVLTTYDDDSDILRAVEAGAKGYLLKDTPREVLTDAVRAAARGETVLAPPIAARLMRRLSRPAGESLTAREVEVLRAVARGRTNAQIGRELSIGEATVKTHLLRAFAKLGVDDRTHAVTVAMHRGLLGSDQPR